MGRALSAFLIVVGFLALVGLAFIPRQVSVVVNVEDSSRTVIAPAEKEPKPEEPSSEQAPPE